jgi:hypothetical protein
MPQIVTSTVSPARSARSGPCSGISLPSATGTRPCRRARSRAGPPNCVGCVRVFEADEDKVIAAVRDGVLVPGLKALEQRFGLAR